MTQSRQVNSDQRYIRNKVEDYILKLIRWPVLLADLMEKMPRIGGAVMAAKGGQFDESKV